MRLAISFVISLFVIGIGTGLMMLSFTKYDIEDDVNSSSYMETEKVIPMTDNLYIHDNYYPIEYVESPFNDLKILIRHSNYYQPDIYHHDNMISFHLNTKDSNRMDMVRKIMEDLNEKKLVNYTNYKITIYTSKENMEKLEANKITYQQQQEQKEKEKLYDEINSLHAELSEKEMEIDSLRSQLDFYEREEEEE